MRADEAIPAAVPVPPRRRLSFVGVAGEVLITLGILTLLYVVWQMWVGDWIFAAQRNSEGQSLSQEWAAEAGPTETPDPAPTDTAEPDAPAPLPAQPTTAEPVILPQPGDGEVFGVLRVPRFGSDYALRIGGGISRSRTLDPIGIGHYPGTAMPGEVGNFAVAGHRLTWGKPFTRIAELRVGDAVVVETPDGWYTYRFRTLEYVTPTSVDVLLPVPQMQGASTGERYMSMMSCSPLYSMAERIVAYAVFESFTPRAAGEPASLTEAPA